MRNACIQAITEAARRDERVVLLMAEVGFSVVEGYEKEFPDRFFNVGIAEQNLVTTAAGMAMRGLRPIAYSMACFLPTRAYEQIKVNVCYQNVPVVLVGVGTGLSYGNMGATHHAIEDLPIMASLPNLTVVCPADPVETRKAIDAALASNGPCYIGIGKNNDPVLHPADLAFEIGKAIVLMEGKDATIIATGGILDNCLQAARVLREEGLEVGVTSMPTVKPLDQEAVRRAFQSRAVFTVDEHNFFGGLSHQVAGSALQQGLATSVFHSYAIPDRFVETVGGRDYQLRQFGLDAESLASDMRTRIRS